MSFLRVKQIAFYVGLPLMWYYTGTFERDNVKKYMFNKGLSLSQKFKKYPQWDNYVEPIIINQCSILFTGGNAFIKGLISDNDNIDDINQDLESYKKSIESDLNDLEKE